MNGRGDQACYGRPIFDLGDDELSSLSLRSTKTQSPSTREAPITNIQSTRTYLLVIGLEDSLGIGAWNLVLRLAGGANHRFSHPSRPPGRVGEKNH